MDRLPAKRAAAIAGVFLACLAGCASPAPSASPSPTSVQAEPNSRLVEFEGHIAGAARSQGQLVQAIAKASTGTPAELAAAARQMADWATTEIDWLDAHPADACYQAAADTYASGTRAILSAASAFAAMAAASPSPDDAAGQAAGQDLSEGRAGIDAAATQAKSLRPGCSVR